MVLARKVFHITDPFPLSLPFSVFSHLSFSFLAVLFSAMTSGLCPLSFLHGLFKVVLLSDSLLR